VFVVEVRAGPEVSARGQGPSKRAAQQAAAQAALRQLEVEPRNETTDQEVMGACSSNA
jgi:dsRNA-specific ribonuclease